MIRPAPGVVPADRVTQQALQAQLERWWDGLSLAERAGVYRDVSKARGTTRPAEDLPRRDDDPVHEQ